MRLHPDCVPVEDPSFLALTQQHPVPAVVEVARQLAEQMLHHATAREDIHQLVRDHHRIYEYLISNSSQSEVRRYRLQHAERVHVSLTVGNAGGGIISVSLTFDAGMNAEYSLIFRLYLDGTLFGTGENLGYVSPQELHRVLRISA